MGNLIAIKVWTHHGDEVICEERSHVNMYELASMSAIAGCMPRVARAEDGLLTWKDIEAVIRPKIYYDSQSALVCLENTFNMWGGTVYPTAQVDDICKHAHGVGLKVHLDGARIFNAATALGESVATMTRERGFGDVLLIEGSGRAGGIGDHRVTGIYREGADLPEDVGGGMRQAGVIAAAGLIALEKSPARLHIDHRNAKRLAEGVAQIPGFVIDPAKVKTNIVIFDCEQTGKNGSGVVRHSLQARTVGTGHGAVFGSVCYALRCERRADRAGA